MTRRICVVTGTRADFGLLRWVMHDIAAHPSLTLQVIATGTHLVPAYGDTIDELHAAGVVPDACLPMLVAGDTPVAVAKSLGLAVIGFADAFARLAPDVVVVLGDRYEILAAAQAALLASIPVAHLHGGEVTTGAIDDAMRHAITKLSSLHFVAAEPYRRRVLQLGEAPDAVHLVGGLGVDAVARLALPSRAALEASLGITLGARTLCVAFHPETATGASPAAQIDELLAALAAETDATLVLTAPNADVGGAAIATRLAAFAATHPAAHYLPSLGQTRWLACLREAEAVVGNSSSGLLEAPSLGCATVNVGARQAGRLRATSVLDVPCERTAIADALAQLRTPAFRAVVADARNPYGDGGAAARIVEVLATTPLDGVGPKRFVDLAPAEAA
ncbi:MAG: UDP-N-acetylglucosamine 2-epimerase [Gemmatimonadaceae bacterium]|nr:UDP-N-acetylglucosamine 2-epimerase [Gemmatimonadaceae bacterium]